MFLNLIMHHSDRCVSGDAESSRKSAKWSHMDPNRSKVEKENPNPNKIMPFARARAQVGPKLAWTQKGLEKKQNVSIC